MLDIGSRSERITGDAIALDLDRRSKPDLCASADWLPIKSGSIDYVVMLEVIEHLNQDQSDRAMDEIKRVSHYLILSTPNCDSAVWDRVVWPFWSHTIGREWLGAHKQFFGKESLVNLLEKKFGMKVLQKNFSHWNLLVFASTSFPSNLDKPLVRFTSETLVS